jgi:hypothetical protein
MGIYRKLVSASRVTLKRIILTEFALPLPVQASASHSQRRIVYQAVDGLLQLSGNITALHLSTGVYLNPTTLEQLSTGKFLPMLDTLELSTTSQGPQFRTLAYLYLFVFAYDMELLERGYLEAAVVALELADYRLGFE